MRNWKRWLIFISTAILSLSVVYVIFNFVFLDFFVDLWWFKSLNFEAYYLSRLFYKYLVFIIVFLAFFLLFFLNFWFASRHIGLSSKGYNPKDTEKEKRYQRLLKMFQSGSLTIYTPISLILSIPIAIPFYEKWETALLYIFGSNSGIKDPAFGKDISYYLFSYPIYNFLQSKLLIIFLLLFLALALLYFIENRMLNKEKQTLPKGAKVHLTFMFFILVIMQTWGFFLERTALLYTESHLPLFFGPGFIEMRLDLPMIWMTIAAFLISALSGIIYLYKRKGLAVFLVCAAVFVVCVSFRNPSFFSKAVQKYIVKPSEAERERPFIKNSIQATLDAYGINEVETRNYSITPGSDFKVSQDVLSNLHNIPVWDRELLDDVYNQVQSIRSYYKFPSVDVDRYTVNGVYQQVYLAARELNLDDLPASAKNWNNIHLQYTHGHGVVITPAAHGGDEPLTWFIRDIPEKSDYGFSLTQPGIYYGLGEYEYVIAPNDQGEIDHNKEDTQVMLNYEGKGGIPLSSILKKILFSVYFKDRNIFFTSETNSKSRILFRRNIIKAINTITPFFLLDNDPYIVTEDNGLYWIIDAYTYSDNYPNAQKYNNIKADSRFKDIEFNYIRNSVKIVVNAYNGDINYYIADSKDPVVAAYKRIYPGLLKNMDEMPEKLKKHTRYPKFLFNIQMNIYAKYHQKNPDVFYREEDSWKFAKVNNRSMKPYHLTLNLINPENHEFLTVLPMSPVGRDNLRALTIVGCDGDNYGKILVYSFPKGQQIYGPSQINALVNQDTEIAQELTLWDQAGSEVIFGRTIILPVENNILYIQPVYLRSASRLKIPELKRIIVSQGEIVVMDASLETALEKLEVRLKERSERIKNRLSGPKKNQEPGKKDQDNKEQNHE
ncbi:UPF0182 family protein [Desulfobacterales bacterium HSG17]|nr:UPF0182 family protein [Desulfobacterales bacterium HSG17]